MGNVGRPANTLALEARLAPHAVGELRRLSAALGAERARDVVVAMGLVAASAAFARLRPRSVEALQVAMQALARVELQLGHRHHPDAGDAATSGCDDCDDDDDRDDDDHDDHDEAAACAAETMRTD